jgi:cell division protein FtsZ
MVLTEKELRYLRHEVTEKGSEPWRCQILTVGKIGCNILDRLTSPKFSGAESITLSEDVPHLEAIHEIESHVDERDIVFILEEAGDEISTDAAAIAETCKKKGATVVGVVIIPPRKEKRRIDLALQALTEMKSVADTIMVMDNDKLMNLTPQPISGASLAEEMLANTIKNIAETITLPSLVSLSFEDFRAMMEHGNIATLGIGESDEPNRAENAAEKAMSQLLFDVNCRDADEALIHVLGGEDLTLEEAMSATVSVKETLDEKALVIWGARAEPSFGSRLRITIILTGMQLSQILSGCLLPEVDLFNLEPFAEPEKPLEMNFNLYQMENWEK